MDDIEKEVSEQYGPVIEINQKLLKHMTPEQRLEFVDQLMAEYCFDCGGEDYDCHCGEKVVDQDMSI
jgi:hypothetical protein